MRACITIAASLILACSTPTDERATEDGSVAHPRCESCHVGDFEGAMDPPHLDRLPTTCFVCHTQHDWAPARLAHDFYPLTGAHLSARCLGCHVAGRDENEPRYEGTNGACVACHRDDYDHSPFPGHSSFPLTCADCHSTSGWTPATHPIDVATHASEPWGEPPPPPPTTLEPPPPPTTPPPTTPPPTTLVHHHRHRPQPPATTTPPPETDEPPPDVETHASRR